MLDDLQLLRVKRIEWFQLDYVPLPEHGNAEHAHGPHGTARREKLKRKRDLVEDDGRNRDRQYQQSERHEQEAQDRGIAYAVGRGRFTTNSRGNISGATEGLVKLIFRHDDRVLLGAHILGEIASELIHVGQAALHHGDTVDYFLDTTFNVPTYAEAYKYAAYDALRDLEAGS